jgi:hypothetical protein
MRHGPETRKAEGLAMKLRWAIVLGVVAAAITLGLVVSVRIGHPDGAFRILTYINYLGMTFGPNLVGKFFDPRRLVPLRAEALLFDVFLVLTSGLQWFLIGATVDLLTRKRSFSGPTPRTP